VGRSLGAKSVFPEQVVEGGTGRDAGRIRPRLTSEREGASADPLRSIAVDVGFVGDGSISEKRTRLLLRDSVMDKVSPVLEPIERRS